MSSPWSRHFHLRAFHVAAWLPLGATLALSPTAALTETVAGMEVPPPLPAGNTVGTYWGVSVPDPYRQLEDIKDPAVEKWLRAQANSADAIFNKIPGRGPLLERMRKIFSASGGFIGRVHRTVDGRLFFERELPGENQFKLVTRDPATGVVTVLVDPETLAKASGRPHAIMDFAPSPDGKRLAYSMQVSGAEIGTLHVIEVATGMEFIESIKGVRYPSVRWLDDGSGFFYSRLREGFDKLPPSERLQDSAVHFQGVNNASTNRAVFSASHNPELKLPSYADGDLFQIPGTRLAGMKVFLGTERYVMFFLADLDTVITGKANWQKVIDISDKVSDLTLTPQWVYVLTSLDAPRFKVLRLPLAAPDYARAQTVIPAGSEVIVDIETARDALYVKRRNGAVVDLLRLDHGVSHKLEKLNLPVIGNVVLESAHSLMDGVVLVLDSWIRRKQVYAYDPQKRAAKSLNLIKVGPYDAPENLEALELRVKSFDGVEVPLSIIMRKDMMLDGRNPTIIDGYGAYGDTEDPSYSLSRLAWLERGGIVAFAHVRGGGVFGDGWHSAGQKATKPNTWRDAIAVTEWLIAKGYTSSKRVAITGRSAGGIMVGRAITERPDLFAAAHIDVGMADAVRAETTEVGGANIPEFGTINREDEFRALLAMSPYHNIQEGTKYPAVLLTHGVNDLRVNIWESAKLASRLSSASSSGKPILLSLDYESGHGAGETTTQWLKRMADRYSFLLWQLGDPEFQPK